MCGDEAVTPSARLTHFNILISYLLESFPRLPVVGCQLSVGLFFQRI